MTRRANLPPVYRYRFLTAQAAEFFLESFETKKKWVSRVQHPQTNCKTDFLEVWVTGTYSPCDNAILKNLLDKRFFDLNRFEYTFAKVEEVSDFLTFMKLNFPTVHVFHPMYEKDKIETPDEKTVIVQGLEDPYFNDKLRKALKEYFAL